MSDLNALNLEPGEVVGGYTLVSRLGAGAMGVGGQDVDGQGFRELDKKFPYTISDPAVFSNGAIIVQKQMVDGKGLKFYASVRLDIRRIQTLKNGDEAVGNRTRVKVVKNKMAPPFKSAEFDMLYGEGISREGSVIDMAQQVGVVKKSGSWFTYEGDQLGQGREKVRQFLKDNPAITEEIENKVKAEFGLIGSADQFAEDEDAAAAAAVSEAAAADAAKDTKATAAPAAKSSRAKA